MFDYHGEKHRASNSHNANNFGGFNSQSWNHFGLIPASPFADHSQQHHQPSFDMQGRSYGSSSGMEWSSTPPDHQMTAFQQTSFLDSLADDQSMDLIQLEPSQPDNISGVGRLVAQFENKSYVPPLPPRAIQQHTGSNDVQMDDSSNDQATYFRNFGHHNASPERITSPVVSPGGGSHFGSFQSRLASPLSTTPGSLPFGSFQDTNPLSSPIENPSSGDFGDFDGYMSSYQSQHSHRQFRQNSFNAPPNPFISDHQTLHNQIIPTPSSNQSTVGTPGFSMWRAPAPNTPKPIPPTTIASSNSNNFFKPPVPTTPKPAIGSQFILEFNPATQKPKAPPKPPRPRMAPPPLPPKISIKEEVATPQLIDLSADSAASHVANTPATPQSATNARPSREQVPAEAWEQYKETIRQLYLEERKPLKEVMAIMAEKHNFQATPKMYKTRFSQWGFVKNNTEDEVKRLLSMKFQRDAEGKVTEFVRNGKVVNLGTYLKRKNKTEYDLIDFEMQGQLPEHVRCRTPTPPPGLAHLRSPELIRAQELVVGNMRKAFLQSRQWEVETTTQVGWVATMTWGTNSSELLVEANFYFEAQDADQGGHSLMNAFKQLEQDLKKLSPQGMIEVLSGMVNRDPGMMTALCKYLAAYSTTNYDRSHPLRQIFSCLYEVQQKHGSATVSDLLWNSLPNIVSELETIYGKRHPYVARTWVDLGLYYNHINIDRLESLISELRAAQQQIEHRHGSQYIDAVTIRYAILQSLNLINPKSKETKNAANELWQTWKSMNCLFPIEDSRPNSYCYHSPLKVDPWTKRCRRRYESGMAIMEEHVGVKAHPYFEEDFHTTQHAHSAPPRNLDAQDSWAAAMSANIPSKWYHI